ncbi:hypothetical protein [Clavibacter capsici]|uniref:PKD domain-containing protein n=1 Tax=Clavibacter capsici TaxID=1874630 RepID=A0AAE7CCF6_9MICO|nr:hypothetical protein [Clavibacter capsici]ALD13194.1 hypothetical protein AES38_09945 [Clavibacter capsici]QIS45374.1 hypothetical protein GW570_09910 [Clavibacter capsici]
MRLRLLAPVVVLFIAIAPAPIAHAETAETPCNFKFGSGGVCTTGGIDGAGVALQAGTTRPGPSSSSHGEDPAPDRTTASERPTRPQAPPPVPRGRSAADVDVSCSPGERLSSGGMCGDGQHAFLPPATWPGKPADPAPAVTDVPGVTLADVARFVPRSASIRSQPNGWALVGAPVNLLTDAAAQVVDGTLLGRPAQVRFVPVSFTWDHGDGTSTTVDGPGASWKQLGQQDFTTTDTSHVYPTMGDRQVTLTIAYAPSYRFDGGGWQQIPGTLPVQVGPVTIHVLQGSTVLVGGACGTRHAGPGC